MPHIYWVNGLLGSLALSVIGYFIVVSVRTAWQSRNLIYFILPLAELALTLVIFGIVDYGGGYPFYWWIIVLWILTRARWLHLALLKATYTGSTYIVIEPSSPEIRSD